MGNHHESNCGFNLTCDELQFENCNSSNFPTSLALVLVLALGYKENNYRTSFIEWYNFRFQGTVNQTSEAEELSVAATNSGTDKQEDLICGLQPPVYRGICSTFGFCTHLLTVYSHLIYILLKGTANDQKLKTLHFSFIGSNIYDCQLWQLCISVHNSFHYGTV